MIANGLVLTAGHCVYSNKPDGYDEEVKRGATPFIGYYNLNSYFVVPGNTWSNGQASAPYGVWTVKNMWTTSDYASGLLGGDWGLIELNPNAQGEYPGDAGIAPFTAGWSQHFSDGAYLFSTGYPTGFGFNQAQYDWGNWQYFCETQWSSTEDAIPNNASNDGNYYGLVVEPCKETSGASGGPVFAYVNGNWMVVGVNNRSQDPPDQYSFGTGMISWWFNDTFGTFWNNVVGQVNRGA